MGSVKELKIDEAPTEDQMGIGVFEFSDDYSVFDYGKMPDKINNKGNALCAATAWNFNMLERKGIKTHMQTRARNNLHIYLVRKLLPWEGTINEETRNFIVPLEVIFRDYIGKKSSVRKRVAREDATWEDFGLDSEPDPDERLPEALIDFSTKFEAVDRYFRNAEEAREYAHISDEHMSQIIKYAKLIATFLREKSDTLGWRHEDGKVEFAIDPDGNIMLVDEVGTLDSDRFLKDNFPLSKQILRDQYEGTPWHQELKAAQEKDTPPEKYPTPPKLNPKIIEFVSNMYPSATNDWTDKKEFEVKSIDALINEDYKQLVEESIIK